MNIEIFFVAHIEILNQKARDIITYWCHPSNVQSWTKLLRCTWIKSAKKTVHDVSCKPWHCSKTENSCETTALTCKWFCFHRKFSWIPGRVRLESGYHQFLSFGHNPFLSLWNTSKKVFGSSFLFWYFESLTMALLEFPQPFAWGAFLLGWPS